MSTPIHIVLLVVNVIAAYVAFSSAQVRESLGHSGKGGYRLVGLHIFLATVSLVIIAYDLTFGMGE